MLLCRFGLRLCRRRNPDPNERLRDFSLATRTSRGTDRSLRMFKSVLASKRMGFPLSLARSFCSFLPLFSSVRLQDDPTVLSLTSSWFLFGLLSGEDRITQSVSRSAIAAALIPCSGLPTCVCYDTTAPLRKCLRHAGT